MDLTMTTHTLEVNDVKFDKETGTILSYEADYRDIEIPSHFDNVEVCIIGRNAFCHNWITNIILPNTLQRLEYGALSMNFITHIVVPESVEFIGEYALYMEDAEIKVDILNENADVDYCAIHSPEYLDELEEEDEF